MNVFFLKNANKSQGTAEVYLSGQALDDATKHQQAPLCL